MRADAVFSYLKDFILSRGGHIDDEESDTVLFASFMVAGRVRECAFRCDGHVLYAYLDLAVLDEHSFDAFEELVRESEDLEMCSVFLRNSPASKTEDSEDEDILVSWTANLYSISNLAAWVAHAEALLPKFDLFLAQVLGTNETLGAKLILAPSRSSYH